MNKNRKISNIINVFQYDETTGNVGINGVPVSGYAAYLHTSVSDGSFGIDSSASINALYLLKNGTKNFEISYDTSGVNKIFRLLPYQTGSFFEIGNPSNAGSDYVFISESIYGNVLIGPGIGNGVSNLTGATAATHKIQFNGAVWANSSIQASSFVITGGASTGFLKANGTIDSSTYATQSYVGTQLANLVGSAPSTLDTLNELAAALGNDTNFATTITNSLATKLALTGGTLTGDLTLSGTNPRLYFTDTDNNPDYFISNTDGTFTVYDVTNSVGRFKIYTTGHAEFTNNVTAASFIKSGGLATQFLMADGSVSTNPGWLTGITSGQVTTALGFTPYNSTNPSGYISGITSGMVTTALGYTPYNSTNPSGYITSSGTAAAISQTIGANGDTNLVYAAIADNDFFRIRVGGSSNAGWVEIATADDGTEPIYVRQYTGVFSSLTRTATLLDGSGNTSFPGTVTATTFSGTIAWTNVSSRPTALSQFTNDLGNYGNWAAASHTHDTLYYGASARLWTGTDGTRNSGWAYHQDNSTGLHWPNNGWHLYPKDATDMYIRSGGTESSIVLNTQGTNRGYVYVNSANEIGFLNNSRSWILRMTSSGDLIMDQNYGNSIVGVYSSTRFQGVYSMGNAYKLAIDGTSPGNLYGISWGHPNAGGQAGYLNDHGMMVMVNGLTYAAISSNVWARGTITANGSAFANGNRLVENNGGSWGITITGNSNYANSAGSASSASSASYAGYLPTLYAGGVQGNPQVYFNNGIGLRAAMTGSWSTWSDTLWINGYAGGDVPWMCALHFLRNSEPRMSISAQTHGSSSYGSYYEVITDYNLAGRRTNALKLWASSHPNDYYIVNNWTGAHWQLTTNHGSPVRVGYADNADTVDGYHLDQNVSTGSSPSFNTIYTSWFRAYGTTGIYQQDYGGHFARSTDGSYGTWQVWGGARGGYSGINIIDPSGYWNNLMYENGNGGAYSQNGNGWQYYYHRGNNCFAMATGTTSGSYRGYVGGSLYAEGDIVAYSDVRKKENIVTVDNAINTVTSLRGVYYNRIDDTTKKRVVGVIAQETEKVLPEVVTYASDIDEYGVSYGNFAGLFIEAFKEQQKQIEDLKKQIEYLVDNK